MTDKPIPGRNWNLEMLVFEGVEKKKQEYPEKKPSEKEGELSTWKSLSGAEQK